MFSMKFKWSFDQIDGSLDAFLDRQMTFLACHVSFDISWATNIDLNAALDDIIVFSQNWVINIDTQLWYSIAPLRPSFLLISAISHVILKFLHKTIKFFFGQVGLAESLFKLDIGDLFPSHGSSSWAHSHDFAVVYNIGQYFFSEVNSSIEILNNRCFTVWKVHLTTSMSKASPLAATPALLTRTSIFPYLSLITLMKLSMLWLSETSSFSRWSWAWGYLLAI